MELNYETLCICISSSSFYMTEHWQIRPLAKSGLPLIGSHLVLLTSVITPGCFRE